MFLRRALFLGGLLPFIRVVQWWLPQYLLGLSAVALLCSSAFVCYRNASPVKATKEAKRNAGGILYGKHSDVLCAGASSVARKIRRPGALSGSPASTSQCVGGFFIKLVSLVIREPTPSSFSRACFCFFFSFSVLEVFESPLGVLRVLRAFVRILYPAYPYESWGVS